MASICYSSHRERQLISCYHAALPVLSNVKIIEPEVFVDNRRFFMEVLFTKLRPPSHRILSADTRKIASTCYMERRFKFGSWHYIYVRP